MAVTEGWTERSWGAGATAGRAPPRSAPRSLKAALSDAGLGDAEAAETRAVRAAPEAVLRSPSQSRFDASGAEVSRSEAKLHEARSPRLAYFATEQPLVTPPAPHGMVTPPVPQGVVSPPPWLRAARRSRWQARMMNTFGWVMTIMIAGSIIGVAGRYLAVPPGFERIQTARQ